LETSAVISTGPITIIGQDMLRISLWLMKFAHPEQSQFDNNAISV